MMMRISIIGVCMLCLCLSCGRSSSADSETRTCLARLDSALNKATEYDSLLNIKLCNLKQKAAQTANVEERYFYNKLIYESYSAVLSDSAICYIDRNQSLARQQQRSDWLLECDLAKARVYSAIGFLEDASALLHSVSARPLSPEQKTEYLMQQIYYWSQRSIYNGKRDADNTGNQRLDEVYAYSDSLMRLVPDESSPYYMWARFWNDRADEQKQENCARIKARLRTMDREDGWYPKLCFALGLLSDALNHRDEALKYYVEGLCIDLAHVSRDLPTLPIVADIACERGALIYANRFMRAYMLMKDDYADRVRRPTMASPPMRIYDSTIRQLEADMAGKNHSIGCLAVLVVALLLVSASVFVLFRKQVKLRRELSSTNRRLEDNLKRVLAYQQELQGVYDSLNEKSKLLEKAHLGLQEANYLKEEYIGNLFAVCSDYLGKMSDLKKSIARKAKARQYDDLQRLATSGDAQMETEIKELNKHFDEIFLGIFPDFVEEFNALLRPDERIAVRKGERLNTDLRIYALVRLGINNSVKIAKILGVSSQTVYNARMKMRGRVTESDEELVARVRKLGGWKTTTDEPTADEDSVN